MAEAAPSSYNYLIISDLHLQEAEKNPVGRLFYFDQEFLDFLRHYRMFYEGQRRWKLIIAGDFIEFYHRIHERPDPNDKLLRGAQLTKTDFKFYPGTEWQKSVWKLDRIARSHQLLFIALARFILEGNEIYILRGNHDLEFFWPQIQDYFRLLVAEFHPSEKSYPDTKDAAMARIHFVPWFYLEPGLVYVEHGHQYDPYCSNAHNLYPVLPGNQQQLEWALSAFTMRYFVARIRHVDPAAMENINSIPRYLLCLVRNNVGQLLLIPLFYVEMVVRTLAKVRPADPTLETPIEQVEAKIREDIKSTYGLTEQAVLAMKRLARPPVLLSRWETVKCFSLDLLLGGLAVLAVGTGFSMAAAGRPATWVSLVAAVLAIGALFLLGKVRVAKFNDHRNLREIAGAIRDTLGCRYVVFGHSHDPDAHPLSHDKAHWYFNVGTWVPTGREGQFVYLEVIRDQGRSSARLMRWDRKGKQPVYLDPASYAKGTAERKEMLAGARTGQREG